MIKNNIIDIRSYLPSKSDRFFFDANIWLYIFCPIGDYRKSMIEPYSAFFKKILNCKSSLCISSLVLLEFTRGYLNIEIKIFAQKYKLKRQINFKKEFRGTSEHKKTLLDIEKAVKSILEIAEKIGDKFEHIDIDNLFQDLDKIDVNDSYHINLASIEQLKIITHDADFGCNKKNSILTANGKLLRNEISLIQ